MDEKEGERGRKRNRKEGGEGVDNWREEREVIGRDEREIVGGKRGRLLEGMKER
jgi:hypothetical protein